MVIYFRRLKISKWLALLRDMSSLGFRLASTMAPQSVTDSVVAVHTFQMAGLAKGYVIPRLKVGKHDGSTVRDGLSGESAHSAGRVALASDGLVEGCDSRKRT